MPLSRHPAEAHSVTSLRLVGRQHELARFDDALDNCLSGRATTLVVGGEVGVGKSRLLREFLRRANARGATTVSGRCLELAEATLPYAPFVEVLRELARRLDPAERDRLFGPGRRELSHLLPELAVDDQAESDRTSPTAQGRLFEILLGFVRRMTEDAPLVAVIEDLHWSDRSTRDLLSFLLRNLDSERVLAICTYRSCELNRGHPLRPFLAELDRIPGVERIDLARFTRAELDEQLEELLGKAPDASWADAVFARSEGNAFFTEELVAVAHDGPATQMPPTLREILLARVDRLTPAAQAVLHVASVAGRQVPEDLLGELSPLAPEERVSGLREAVAKQVLVLEGDDSYSFRHALQREAVYEQLLPSERTELHAAYARALEARPKPASVGEIAYHWRASHDLPRALGASVAAGRAAERSDGFAEAQRLYELALELWPQVPDAAERAGIDEIALTRRAAESANLAGEHGRAAALARKAIELTGALKPSFAGVLYERLGRFLWASGDSAAALNAYENAVRLVPPDPPSPARARALAARGQALMLMARYRESLESCTEAIAIARAVAARAEEGHALNTLGFDLVCLGDPEAGVERMREALTIAEEVGDLDDLARAYLNLSEVLAGPLNRLDEALALALDGVEVARRVGLASDYGVSLQANAANALYSLGRWDEALAVLDEAEQARPTEMAAIDFHQSRAGLFVSRGDLARAGGQLDAVRRLMANTVDPQYNVPLCAREAEHALWQGRHGEAQAAVAEGLGHLANTDDVWLLGRLLWLGAWAEVDASLEARVRRDVSELSSAQRFGDDLRDILAHRERRGRFMPPSTLAYSAMGAAELSRLEPSSDPGTWTAVTQEWQRLGHPYPYAYARWREGEALLLNRRMREAEEPLRSAHAVARGLGALPLLRELAALAGRAKIDLDAGPPGGDGKPSLAEELGLTRRQQQVLALIADGLTNREISRVLFVTEKTASAHVSGVLGRLGVRSRVEAATAAHRLGLLPAVTSAGQST